MSTSKKRPAGTAAGTAGGGVRRDVGAAAPTAAPPSPASAAPSPSPAPGGPVAASSSPAPASPDAVPPVPTTSSVSALQTPDQVRAVAHLLSDAADAYNERLKAEAAQLSSGEVFARLQEEQRLRGVSNQLYFEAGERTLAEAVDAQEALEATLRDARAKLLKFQQFQHTLALVADLLVLAGAIVARKAPTVIAALKEVRKDLKAPVAADA